LPFGLTNAPATFQRLINKTLAGLLDTCCIAYLDDVLIYSRTFEEHEQHVKQVLERLRKNGLYCKISKCEFAVQQTMFLGHVVSTEGVEMDPDRVATVKDWPLPKTQRDIQVFIGFANYYRRFIRNFSLIAAPLTRILKGGRVAGPLRLTKDAVQAFENLKDAFANGTVLRHFDYKLPITLETDASGFAIGAVLSQVNPDGHRQPVAFYSRKMIPAERNYETHDGELLAIVEAFLHWRHYLQGA
jgi:hypothetical protein